MGNHSFRGSGCPYFFQQPKPTTTQIVTKNTHKKNSQYILKIAFINEKNSLGISDDSIIAKQKARGGLKTTIVLLIKQKKGIKYEDARKNC